MFAYYNGKIVDMEPLRPQCPDARRLFSLACYRVRDNAKQGYVLDGTKLYFLSPASRMAKLVSGEERTRVLAEIENLKEVTS